LLAVADLMDYDIVRTTAVRTRRGLGRSPLMSTWGSYPGSKLAFQIALPMHEVNDRFKTDGASALAWSERQT
ncbi:hypothetical protein KBZ21_52565, partial [Streptomyces sp. A73]|nr:hypothetical protein [Streptomyces sp. A73]